MENGIEKAKQQGRRLKQRILKNGNGSAKMRNTDFAMADVADFAASKISHLLKTRKEIRAKSAAFLRKNWKPMVGMLSVAAGTYMLVNGTKSKGLKHELKQKTH